MIRRSLAFAVLAASLLASTAVPALAQDPSPDSLEPQPSGAPALEALFPTQIGGSPLDIQSYNGADMMAQFPEEDPGTATLKAILATQGRTIADLSVANGAVDAEAGFASIIALQIAGADAAALLDGFAPLVIGYDVKRTPIQLGGKDVVKLEPTLYGPSIEPIYAYTKGDVLWFIQSQEPLLSEAFGKLP